MGSFCKPQLSPVIAVLTLATRMLVCTAHSRASGSIGPSELLNFSAQVTTGVLSTFSDESCHFSLDNPPLCAVLSFEAVTLSDWEG